MNATPLVTSVSACFPCYNDARTIEKMVNDVRTALRPLVDDLEIIVVDDGSSDGSPEVLRALEANVAELRVIVHPSNRGYGGALLSAFTTAKNDWIFYTDGDAQYDATEAAALVQAVQGDTDVVQGHKIGRGDTLTRKVIGRIYHHGVKLLFRLPVRDTDCDFRLFRRQLVVDHPLSSTTGVICVEMMRTFQQAGARFVEVPVHHYYRPHGRSQFFRLPHILRAASGLVRLWWHMMVCPRFSRSGRPAR